MYKANIAIIGVTAILLSGCGGSGSTAIVPTVDYVPSTGVPTASCAGVSNRAMSSTYSQNCTPDVSP